MSIKLIEEVHEKVNLEGADTEYHMFLGLSAVSAVVTTRLLPFHPQIRKLLKLTAAERGISFISKRIIQSHNFLLYTVKQK